MIAIQKFQINGRSTVAETDSTDLHVSLCTEGQADTMCLAIYEGDRLCWSSGQVPCAAHHVFEHAALEPCSTYRAVMTLQGESTDSREIKLHTGLMGKPWAARWIEPEQEPAIAERPIQFFEQFLPMPDHFGGHVRLRPAQELRRVFTLDELPRRAMFCASAHGVYALWLNGKRVDARRLAPETTPYESMLYYQVYDLTHLLCKGENTLRVLLGDGWWIGRIGLTGDSCQYGDKLAFLGQMELDFGGRREIIVTDEQFESRPSFIRYADLFMGEKWDLNAPAAPWRACRSGEAADGKVVLQTVEPVAVWTELEPVSVGMTPKGELVADFGQCMAGVVELRLNCPKGREVTLDHSETLDQEGNFFRNILGRNKDQQDKVICGGGETVFCPEFTYHGFRYVRIDGASRDEILSVRAKVIGTKLEGMGTFRCSHEGLNQLQHNIQWATRSNMVAVPTDCPQREKAGWTGDIQVFAPTGCFNYDLHGFLTAWLGQMRIAQTGDGGIPIVIPSYPAQTAMQTGTFGGNTSAAWSDACVLLPLILYENSGDIKVLQDNLGMMEKWLGFIENASHDYLWTEGYHFGDWLIPSFQDDVTGGTAATDKVIASCQYAITVESYLKVLKALHEPEGKIARYEELLCNIREAVQKRFVSENGMVTGDLQGLYVMVLCSGSVTGDLAAKVAARLVALIEKNGGGLDTGFVSTPHLLDVLVEHGYEDLAWKMLFRTESPSWLYQVEKGATSMWENWNAIRPDGTVTTSSYNHYALGCVGDWIYRHIGGLNRRSAGWRDIEFAPNVNCGLDWSECSHLTPNGLAACRWERTGEGTTVEVTVPCGVRATLNLPGLERELTAGVHKFTVE